MKKFLSTSVLLLMTVLTVSAQQKANYPLAERFSREKIKKMVHSTAVSPNWLKTGDKFWYSYKTTEGTNWYLVDPAAKTKKPLFDNAVMAQELSKLTHSPFDARNLPLENIRFNNDATAFTFEIKNKYYTKDEQDTVKNKKESDVGDTFFFSYDTSTGSLTRLYGVDRPKDQPEWASVSPDGKTVVFSKNYNLYWMDRNNYNKALRDEKDSTIIEYRITEDGAEGFEYGESDAYEKNTDIEENRNRRRESYTVWSPDSKYFAVVRYDTRKTPKLWVIDPLASPRPTLESYPYLMPGENNAPQERLFIFDNETKTGREADVSAFKDQSISINPRPYLKKNRTDTIKPVIWEGDGKYLYVTRTSRDIKRIDVIRVEVETLKPNIVVRDSMNVSIETRPIRVINNGADVVTWSERDGWGHFYLYGSDGTFKNRITSGEMHADRIVGIDEQKGVLYFTANGGVEGIDPYYEHLYSIRLDGTGLKSLNPGDFDTRTNMSDDNRYFVSNYSRVDMTPESALYGNNGKKLMDLEKADLSLLMEAGYKFPERFTVKAADGVTDLYGVMYKPFDFDPDKKYPIIDYVYPGPQEEATNTMFSTIMTRIDQLAQLGFIVITVGNRGGSPLRSKWYHAYGYGNLRDYGLADQKRAIETLAARHDFIDISKVGIHGHSGGGFMSTAALLTYPDFFKVAVSAAGNHDNRIYNNWWSEKHHGIREIVNTEGDTTYVYNIATNQELAKNLKGKLLLVHGVVDDNVHIANTYRVAEALIKANKRFDILVLPSENHGFYGKDSYFFWRMADYFAEHLLGESKRDETDIPELNE